jgi:chaperonin GroEL
MPFEDPYFEYFAGIIVPAAKEVGLTAIKADDIFGTTPIIHDVWSQIWRARAIIADVTGKNPNVNYELGLCHALGVPTVLITQNIEDVPFDYRHLRCIPYETKRVDWQEKLRRRISLTLKSVIAGLDPYEDLRWPYDTNALQSLRSIGTLVPAEEGTESVIKGARLVRDATARALGPHGTNVSVSQTYGNDRFDRSGVVIASATSSFDPLQQKGVEHARRLAQEMHATVGDGSKTSILIFQEMVEHGYKACQSGIMQRDLIHEMDVCVEEVVSALGAISRLPKAKDIASVARTAAAGDAFIGNVISEALAKAGKDGVVSLTETSQPNTSLEVREGFYFDRGLLSTRFITDESRQVAELSDAFVLMCDSTVSSMRSLLPVLEQVIGANAPLLVIANNVEGEALELLALNKEKRTLRCAAVRRPAIESLLEDIAVATGGTVISRSSTSLENVHISQLGRAKKVEITKDGSWISGGAGTAQAIDSRAAGIRKQIEIEGSDYDKERLQIRLAMLVGTICAITVGGASSLDRAERMYKAQTALHSARSALISGVVPGGGTAYLRAKRAVRDGTEARRIVLGAIDAPARQQILNARLSDREFVPKIEAASEKWVGFNAESRQGTDLDEAGVLDAVAVCVSALNMAFTHARAILQTGVWDLTERSAPNFGRMGAGEQG